MIKVEGSRSKTTGDSRKDLLLEANERLLKLAGSWVVHTDRAYEEVILPTGQIAVVKAINYALGFTTLDDIYEAVEHILFTIRQDAKVAFPSPNDVLWLRRPFVLDTEPDIVTKTVRYIVSCRVNLTTDLPIELLMDQGFLKATL